MCKFWNARRLESMVGAMFFLWITGVFKWRTVHAYFAIWSAPREGGSLLQ